MPMNDLAIAGNFFLFIEILGKFQVVYGTFWIELFLACQNIWNILDSILFYSILSHNLGRSSGHHR